MTIVDFQIWEMFVENKEFLIETIQGKLGGRGIYKFKWYLEGGFVIGREVAWESAINDIIEQAFCMLEKQPG